MPSVVSIGDCQVGAGHRPFIAAEVGLNHNGDLGRALEMIHVAKRAGCDAVKFQTFRAGEFIADPAQMFTYRSQGHEITESMLAMFERHELPESAWPVIKQECEREGIRFFSTPQNASDLEILLTVGVPAVKVGSDDFTNLALLRRYARSGLPLILSSGMSDLEEVEQALDAVGAPAGYPTILLVCTSQYPTPPADANLARITTLRGKFPSIPIGFSDHTSGSLAAVIAVALGACFLEKHFTLSHDLPGPDHWFSEEPEGLTQWVAAIRTAETALGSGVVRPSAIEARNKLEYQRRVVAARDISAGETLDEASLTLRRVAGGRGAPASRMLQLLGRAAPRAYQRGEPIEL